jgi:hypothetical protein
MAGGETGCIVAKPEAWSRNCRIGRLQGGEIAKSPSLGSLVLHLVFKVLATAQRPARVLLLSLFPVTRFTASHPLVHPTSLEMLAFVCLSALLSEFVLVACTGRTARLTLAL